MSEAAPAEASTTTTSESQEISLPAYLVNWDMPNELTELVRRGELSLAESWLSQQLANDNSNSGAFVHEQQRLRRLAREFNMTPENLLIKIQQQVPDATLEDIETWRKAGGLQWLCIDGGGRYFRREPSNLFLFEESARRRRISKTGRGDPAAASADELTSHCAQALSFARELGTTVPLPMTFRVSHTIKVKPGAVPKGEIIRCWMPFPQAYRQQMEPQLISASPADPQIAPNGSPMRTLYFEQVAGDEESIFCAEYKYRTSAYVPDLDTEGAGQPDLANEVRGECLDANPPHVELTPAIRDLASSLCGNETDPVRKAYAIWSWIDENVAWAAEMEYAVLPNIVRKVLACKRGDCGTQALLFISLCRASGVPARWQSGWVMRPKKWNLHDWAEFYSERHGWLPADPSIGRRKSQDPATRDFLFGHIDSYRMIANLDYGRDFVPAKEHLRSDPVDNQRGEVEWRGGNLYFDDWTYNVEVSAENADEALLFPLRHDIGTPTADSTEAHPGGARWQM